MMRFTNQSWGIKMKKVLLPIAALTLGLASVQAFAADGTVSFTGNITQSGCVVSNATNKTITVPMGNYSSSAFAKPGDTAGPKPFQINLTGCATGSVKLRFDGTAVPGNTGLLQLSSTATAPYVGIQIMDAATQAAYTIGDSSAITAQAVGSDGSLQLKLVARYVAIKTGVPTGAANANTDFSIEYQ